MKKVYIIHGWEWSPQHWWIAWLTTQLQKEGSQVCALSMPNPKKPAIKEWLAYLQQEISPDKDAILIGHSVWVQAILRWTAWLSEDKKFAWLISVAGWFHLHNLEDKESEEIAHDWLSDDVDWVKAADHFSWIKAIFSDDDQWVPISDSLLFHERLWSEIIIESGMWHIYRLDPEKGYERLLRIVKGNDIDQNKENKLDEKTWPIITVIDNDGTELWSFPASKHESILDTAEKHGIDIGYSCRSGACFSCACHIQSNPADIDIGKFGYPLVDVDEGDCLACISGVVDEVWGMEWNDIIIKKF